MTIATKLALNQCNFRCEYCWEKPNKPCDIIDTRNFDYESIIDSMKKLHNEYPEEDIVIHAGEVTAYPKKEIELLIQEASNLTNSVSVQTNGYKLDKFIDLFEKYDMSIGLSFDGLREANLLRGFGSREQRLEQAKKIEENMIEALDRGLELGIISIITRQNGIKHIDKLKELLLLLNDYGQNDGRLNPCTITSDISGKKPPYELEMDELIDVYDELFDFCKEHGLSYTPFKDIAGNLVKRERTVCRFNPCDIYSTDSLKGILKDGTIGNCVKTYGDRDPYPRADNMRADIRQKLLQETDCKGCKWFNYCNGGCPNAGIGDDWRRKTRYCKLWRHLFEKISNSLNAFRIDKEGNENKKLELNPNDEHGDHHGDRPHGNSSGGHGDRSHGDRAHGDSPHGDSK